MNVDITHNYGPNFYPQVGPSTYGTSHGPVDRVEFGMLPVSVEHFDVMRKYAAQLQIKGAPSENKWNYWTTQVEAGQTLSSKDISDIKVYAGDVKTLYGRLRRQQRAEKASVTPPTMHLAHSFLHQYSVTARSYAQSTALSALHAAAGAGFGPALTASAYIAETGHSQDEVKELVSHLQALADGDSDIISHGNRVTPVHREKLWQAKMKLLDDAKASAEKGYPPEINLQYFELTSPDFMEKLCAAALAGCPVRINIDPSRPSGGGDTGHSVDDGPKKLRALMQLSQLKGANVGVSIFPVKKELGSLTHLMHRKMLRVGEKVLLGGMNANQGSGDNIDAGMIIEGPAARRIVELFERDVQTSTQASATDIYGDQDLSQFLKDNITLNAGGLYTLLDCLGGPTHSGVRLPVNPTYDELSAMAEKVGRTLENLVEGGKDLEAQIDSSRRLTAPLVLKPEGRKLFAGLVNKAIGQTNSPKNLKNLAEISLPSDKVRGTTAVGLGDLPVEREALMLHAIANEDKFIYMPAFVLTRPVALALIARRNELRAQGKELDVRVVLDPGIYGFGSNPNEKAILELEDAAVPVRWAVLPRTDKFHDRKVHAKQLITSKVELFGTTNFSKKGMRDNWELSGMVVFDPDDAKSMRERQASIDGFNKLWTHDSLETNSSRLASIRLLDYTGPDRAMKFDDMRAAFHRSTAFRIRNFEIQAFSWLENQRTRLEISARIRDIEKTGVSKGFAMLMGIEQGMGTENYYKQLTSLPSYQNILHSTIPGAGAA